MIYNAYFADPSQSYAIKGIIEVGKEQGYRIAFAQYPTIVIDDKSELGRMGEEKCDEWWASLTDYKKFMHYLPGVKRTFVPAFIAGYQETIEERRHYYKEKAIKQRENEHKQRIEGKWREAEEAEKRRRETLLKRGVTIRLKGQESESYNSSYLAEFIDPVRMTNPILFKITVWEDGVVELEEAEKEGTENTEKTEEELSD